MIFIYNFGILLASIGNAAGDFYTKFSNNCDPSVNILSTQVTSMASCALVCDIQESCRTLSYKQTTLACNIHAYIPTNCPSGTSLGWIRFKREVPTDSTTSLGAECSFNTTTPVVSLKSRCGENFIQTPLIFKLQVCDLARVNLKTTSYDQYLVDIASSTSFIRFISGLTSDDNPTIYDVMTSCNESRWFWITWSKNNGDTTVNVGTGFQEGSNIFMTRTDTWEKTITDAVISTMGGNTGYWTFYEQ